MLILLPGGLMTIILLFILAPILLLGLVSRLRRKPYPPGPAGLPIIGNMLMMDQLSHRGLARLAHRYGGLFHLKMGFVHMVVVSSPEVARQVLQVQDIIFSNRPATVAIRYLTYNRADLVFAHYGPFSWRQMRKLCVMRLFSRKRAESWQSVRDEVSKVILTIAGQVGSEVNVGESAFNFSKNITYRAAFGLCSSMGQGGFVSIIQEFSKLFGEFNVADFIPFLGWIDPNGLNQRLVKARAALDQFIDTIIDEHLNKRKGAHGRISEIKDQEEDMVDDLLNFYSEEEAKVTESDDLQNAIELTRDNIKGIIMDVMFGGTETVASAIEWCMADLMRSPQDMKRVQQELAIVVGLTRRVTESDLDKLCFLRCCIKETLRLHPPVPILLHETSKEAFVGEYRIPKGARVMINVWAIGRDPSSWSDPETFKPSRFMQDGVPDFKGGNFEFIPFGSGRRSCPGMQLGVYALEMCVANIVHCFTWELPNGMTPSELDMDDVSGLTAPRASRLVAVPSPRLLCTLY